MRGIKLTFTDPGYVEKLMQDQKFVQNAAYLTPKKLDDLNIAFHDPVTEHFY